jgi:uncharacterized protein (TIGR02145 family)
MKKASSCFYAAILALRLKIIVARLIILTFSYFLSTNTFSQFNPNLTYGVVNDVEGNRYKTIKIGTQLWMAENLRATKYNDGSDIPLAFDQGNWEENWNLGNSSKQPMMCWYNDDSLTYKNKYGALYNWYAINPSTNGKKNVCPIGWHVPSDTEWATLITFLGGKSIAGGKMKSTGTQFWRSPNNGATNSSGFTALPAGKRGPKGHFSYQGGSSYFWTSTASNTNDAWYLYLYYQYINIERFPNFTDLAVKYYGFSVRCIKN